MISIFGSDGSVQLTHGGIECGQGILEIIITDKQSINNN